jgi:hypothetical protein
MQGGRPVKHDSPERAARDEWRSRRTWRVIWGGFASIAIAFVVFFGLAAAGALTVNRVLVLALVTFIAWNVLETAEAVDLFWGWTRRRNKRDRRRQQRERARRRAKGERSA